MAESSPRGAPDEPLVLGHGDLLTTELLTGLAIDLDELFTLDV